MNELYSRYVSISLFRSVAHAAEPLVRLCTAASQDERNKAAADVFLSVAEAGCDSVGEWLEALVLADVNPFSKAAARGEHISPRIKKQAEEELVTFKLLSALDPRDFGTQPYFPGFGYGGFSLTVDKLVKSYLTGGYGVFNGGNTFLYTGGKFVPTSVERVALGDLKNYSEEKAEIVKNTENFIAGLPAFHALLYGDRGTGKSTTVRALSNEYRDRLKVVELPKAELDALPSVMTALDGLKQKFIVFIDDLSFDETDERAENFKAALEGSLSSRSNALLYCTTNRRHLFRETEKDVRRNDDVQSELSLFDRFGLVVTYILPSKSEFLDIFRQILRDRSIKWRDEYAQIAELAALKKGGRSPRVAKQIADLIEATYIEAEKK